MPYVMPDDDPKAQLERVLTTSWRGSFDERRTTILALVDRIYREEGPCVALRQLQQIRQTLTVDQRIRKACDLRFTAWYAEAPIEQLIALAPRGQAASALEEAVRRGATREIEYVAAGLLDLARQRQDWRLRVEVALLTIPIRHRNVGDFLAACREVQDELPVSASEAHATLATGVLGAVGAHRLDLGEIEATLRLLDPERVRRSGLDEDRADLELSAAALARADGDLDQSITYLKAAFARDTRYAWTNALFQLDDIYAVLERRGEMRGLLQASLGRRGVSGPTARAIRERLGVAYFAAGDPASARTHLIAAYRELTRLDSANPEALTVYGLVLLERGAPGDDVVAEWAFERARSEAAELNTGRPQRAGPTGAHRAALPSR